jgi:hypothetical protein
MPFGLVGTWLLGVYLPERVGTRFRAKSPSARVNDSSVHAFTVDMDIPRCSSPLFTTVAEANGECLVSVHQSSKWKVKRQEKVAPTFLASEGIQHTTLPMSPWSAITECRTPYSGNTSPSTVTSAE